MKIDNILKRLEPEQDDRKSRILYDSFEKALRPSNFTNESRLATFMQLLMLCSEERGNKMNTEFAKNILAFDYYMSVCHANKAVPFLNHAMECSGLTGIEFLPVTDKERFIGEFRSLNLKGKRKREQMSVRNILVLHQATRKMNLDLNLDELVLDYVPDSYVWEGFLASLVLILAGLYIALYQFEEYRIERLSGGYMPFLDALQPGEIPVVLIALSVAVTAGWYTFAKCTPLHVRLMSRYYYWRYSRN